MRRNPSTFTTSIFWSSDSNNHISRMGSKRARCHADNNDDISIQLFIQMPFMQQEQDWADCQVDKGLHGVRTSNSFRR